jgi:signal peptidase I
MHSAMMAQVGLQYGQTLWVTVNGDSMWPLIVPGDRLLLEPVDSLRIGDLITFYEVSTLCTHRVMGKIKKAGELLLRTKGDCCGQWDQPIPVESIVGKVVAIQKRDRLLVLKGPLWRGLNLMFLVLSVGMGGLLRLKWKFSQIIPSH